MSVPPWVRCCRGGATTELSFTVVVVRPVLSSVDGPSRRISGAGNNHGASSQVRACLHGWGVPLHDRLALGPVWVVSEGGNVGGTAGSWSSPPCVTPPRRASRREAVCSLNLEAENMRLWVLVTWPLRWTLQKPPQATQAGHHRSKMRVPSGLLSAEPRFLASTRPPDHCVLTWGAESCLLSLC